MKQKCDFIYVILIILLYFIYFIFCFVFKYLTTKYSSQVQSKWRSNQENPKSTQAVSSTLLCQRPAAACAHMVNNLTHCLENTPAQFLRKHFTAATQLQSQLVSGLSGWLVDWSFSRKPFIFQLVLVHLTLRSGSEVFLCSKAATLNLH